MIDKREIAEVLLQIKAVFLRPEEPFTWASGIKSPIYCDNRLVLSYPEARNVIEDAISKAITEHYPDCEMLMGTSTAGIAHAALAAERLNLPMGYVRGSAKDHGRNNKIEGRLTEGQKVVIVEDLISTAGSAIDAAMAVKEAGGDVLGIVSIFTYGMKKGLDRLAQSGLKNVSLSDIDTLLEVAASNGYIQSEDMGRILRFRDNPQDPSWMKGEE